MAFIQINFTLEYFGTVQGSVTNETGNRLTDDEYYVQILIYDANSGEYIDYDKTSFVGDYQFVLLERDCKLSAVSFSFNWLSDPDCFAVSYYENGTGFNDANTEVIFLSPKTTVSLNSLVTEEINDSAAGAVYCDDVAQSMTKDMYLVLAFDEDGYVATVAGYSDLSGSPDGDYVL